MTELDPLFALLKKRKNSLTVFNPYREEHKLDNLKHYFSKVFNQAGPKILLVGEAPGFKGCRLTGIPFSSGKLFTEVDHPFLKELQTNITLSTLEAENTASIVWRHLVSHEAVPLFWNAFPFHPHPSRLQRKNRVPNAKEMEEGSIYLKMLVEFYQPDLIAGLGRKGADSVQRVLPDEQVIYIRHPSYGGKSDFITGIDQLYQRLSQSR